MKRILLLILALVLPLSIIACTPKTPDGPADTTGGPTTQHGNSGEDETDDPYDPDLPAGLTFKKGNTPATFTVLTQDYSAAVTDFIVQENSTDAIDQLVMERNAYVEELLGVVFDFIPVAYDKTNDRITQESMAGKSPIDLVSARATWGFLNLTNGYLSEWNDVPYVDLEKAWWMQKSINEISVNGKTYILQGDINPSEITHQYCMYFNKTKAETYLPDEDIFGLVSNYEWTQEKLLNLVKDIYESADENRDTSDFYGMVAQVTHYAQGVQFAYDLKITAQTEDGFPVIDINIDKWSSAISGIYDFLYKTEGVYADNTWENYYKMFASGQCIFVSGVFAHAMLGRYKEMTDLYGIIPYPLYDDTQETYYSMIDNSASSVYFMKNVNDKAMLGAVVQALGAYSLENITPEIYEVALKYRYSSSQEQIEMIDFIHNGVSFDLGYVYSVGPRVDTIVNTNKSNNYVSYHTGQNKSWEKKIEDFIEFYLGVKK